jgi:hypothetical protein
LELIGLFDLDEKFNKLYKLYDSKIELSGILVFTAIIGVLLTIVLLDNRETTIENKIFYEQLIPNEYRNLILGIAIIYLFALYVFSKKKIKPTPRVDEALCPICKIQMEIHKWKCPNCKKEFG